MQQFRGGLAFKAQRRWYRLSVTKKKFMGMVQTHRDASQTVGPTAAAGEKSAVPNPDDPNGVITLGFGCMAQLQRRQGAFYGQGRDFCGQSRIDVFMVRVDFLWPGSYPA